MAQPGWLCVFHGLTFPPDVAEEDEVVEAQSSMDSVASADASHGPTVEGRDMPDCFQRSQPNLVHALACRK
jgi:hypothetical protein